MLDLQDIAIPMDRGVLRARGTLEPGQRIAVLGASGAGKSTLLDAIAGFRPLSAGRMLWQGHEITTAPPQERPVSILFQDNNLFAHLSLTRNLGLALRPDGGRLTAEMAGQVNRALASVGLDGFGPRLPGTLSGGQLSRAALARVLLQDRPILLLDEPFAALGPATRSDMLSLVVDTVAGRDVLLILVTHDPDEARRFATHVIMVADGSVAPPVETEVLFREPPPALRRYLGPGTGP